MIRKLLYVLSVVLSVLVPLSVLTSVLMSVPSAVAGEDLSFLTPAQPMVWTMTKPGVWARVADSITMTEEKNDQGTVVRTVVHTGYQDWALTPTTPVVAVVPGEVYQIEAEVNIPDHGNTQISAVLYGGKDVLSWSYGSKSTDRTAGWTTLKTRFIIPLDGTAIQPRLIGSGACSVMVRNYRLNRIGTVDVDRTSEIKTLENDTLRFDFDLKDGLFSVLDKRTGRQWRQASSAFDILLNKGVVTENRLTVNGIDLRNFCPVELRFSLDGQKPEIVFEISAENQTQRDMTATVAYPKPFLSQPGDRIIWPMNEGVSYPVDELTYRTDITFGGHGLCMAFWGVTEDQTDASGKRSSYMGIVQTPDDAAITIRPERTPQNELNAAAPVWQPQRGKFGYTRSIRYVFFDGSDGCQGHVSICKRYRQYAQQIGLWVPFTEKARRNPALKDGFDRLIGAANIWYMGHGPSNLDMLKRMQELGMDRILWSANGSPEHIRTMNAMPNVLTSRYDIYQDIMNPAEEEKLGYMHGDWIPQAWPKEIMLNSSGDWIRGWGVRQKDKTKPMIHCGVLCDSRAPKYAREKIAKEQESKMLKARFIDTTTASSWRECYHPDHPLNRTQSKQYKMELLGLMGKEFNLVCGSETGHDASVPYCDFFEGMMSLGPYRVPDSGRDLLTIWHEPPENVVKFQLGEGYRLPLWELVYHDCTVSYWYWGDYNNKLPSLWNKRDVFNALYAVPPMYLFNGTIWKENEARFAASYKRAQPVSRLAGGVEMTDHRILNDDRTVQQTKFANGVTVIANFGDKVYTTVQGDEVQPLDYIVYK